MKSDAYPMHCAKRCKAQSKRTGLPCKSPAVKGWEVCRMHGARGGATVGSGNPAYRHGRRSKELKKMQEIIRKMIRKSRSAIKDCEDTQIN